MMTLPFPSTQAHTCLIQLQSDAIETAIRVDRPRSVRVLQDCVGCGKGAGGRSAGRRPSRGDDGGPRLMTLGSRTRGREPAGLDAGRAGPERRPGGARQGLASANMRAQGTDGP